MIENCSLCQEKLDPRAHKVIQAGPLFLHEQCYICVQCFQPFSGGTYFMHEDRPYCKHDYWQLFGPRCALCTEDIIGECLTALGQKWHPEHFKCEVCDMSLVGANYAKNTDRPLCRPCYTELNRKEVKKPKCEQCGKELSDRFLLVKGKRIHPEHLNCHMCKCTLNHLGRERNNQWFCHFCYEKALTMSVCGACKCVIEGRSVTALGKVFHPEHFVCAKCEMPFSGDAHHEYNGAAYCSTHYRQLTGSACFVCQKVVKGKDSGYANLLNKDWCAGHLRCFGCDKTLGNPPKFFDWDLKPLCAPCLEALPSATQKSLVKQAKIAKEHAKARR